MQSEIAGLTSASQSPPDRLHGSLRASLLPLLQDQAVAATAPRCPQRHPRPHPRRRLLLHTQHLRHPLHHPRQGRHDPLRGPPDSRLVANVLQ